VSLLPKEGNKAAHLENVGLNLVIKSVLKWFGNVKRKMSMSSIAQLQRYLKQEKRVHARNRNGLET